MSSGLKHAVKSRVHLERGAPRHRQRYGLLEKHKDYKLRARNYHAKEKQLSILQEKARSRNPDEFYFKMVNASSKKPSGPGQSKGQQRLMDTQNLAYVAMRKSVDDKRVEALESELHRTGEARQNRRWVFHDSDDDAREREGPGPTKKRRLESKGGMQQDSSSSSSPAQPSSSAAARGDHQVGRAGDGAALMYQEVERRKRRAVSYQRVIDNLTERRKGRDHRKKNERLR